MQTIIISPQNVKHSENYYEDEFSYLKDEIYKTAISLNEQTINLENDKKNLKKSLEDISHQLKTPLTSITLMTDKILSGNIDKKEQEKLLTNIHRKVVNTNFLVYSLLKLSLKPNINNGIFTSIFFIFSFL